MALKVIDASGVVQNLSTSLDGSGNLVGATSMTDPVTGMKATVVVLHQADGQQPGTTANGLLTGGVELLFNGATLDRQRGNVDTGALIAAAAATTTQTGADQTNYNNRGVKVVLNMTAVGTGSVTLTIQGKDTASGVYYTLLAGVAVTTNSINVYEVYPGIAAAANAAASATLPRTWRVLVTANNANPATYTVGASVIV